MFRPSIMASGALRQKLSMNSLPTIPPKYEAFRTLGSREFPYSSWITGKPEPIRGRLCENRIRMVEINDHTN